MSTNLLQGTLDLLILKTLAQGPLHGYGIAQRILASSRQTLDVQQGSLYPALHRLENRGYLKAEWRVTESGREAKFYSLTRKGRTQLESETAGWLRLAEAVGVVLQLKKEVPE